MDIFGLLELIGGLALFLFGMSLMGTGLERSAGNKLKDLLERLTSTKLNGFLMGLVVTAVIQSSSATTVMVVGFVNSGIMTLRQAIHVIMGANVGTTVTAWVLSLSGIEGDNLIVQLLKPASFTPILALIGIVFYLFLNDKKKKDIGMIFLGFTTLIYGMEAMSGAVKPLAELEGFRNALLIFSNPILGVLAGAVLTGILQSSSASVGILQALSLTGKVSIGTAVPIIMGQNIGTCATALISSVGTNKNARRAALVHFYFNVIGTTIFLILFVVAKNLFHMAFVDTIANPMFIAISHSVFNILCTAVLLPFSALLERLAYRTIPEDEKQDKVSLLDPRLFSTPALAIKRSFEVTVEMAKVSMRGVKESFELIKNYDEDKAQEVMYAEEKTDYYEDALGTYLVKLSRQNLSAENNTEVAKLLYLIGEFERLTDYSLNITRAAQEMYEKKIDFSEAAKKELNVMISAVEEIVEMAINSFKNNDITLASKVEPLEEVIDDLKSTLKMNHVARLQGTECTLEMGFVFSDMIAAMERISDHCSNIAGCIIEMTHDSLNMHKYLDNLKHEPDNEYAKLYEKFSKKYTIV